MDNETLRLLVDLHGNNQRQGPGCDAAFNRALSLSGLDTTAKLNIADIGCGTGSATIPLLQQTAAHVTAVDFLPAFLETLETKAMAAGVADRLTTLAADMGDLPFNDEQFDALWAEGAIYTIGFKNGITAWRRFLKPGGVLVVSEITWLQPTVPPELKAHWEVEYSEVATASTKIQQLETAGYSLLGYFPLPEEAWLENYYTPIETKLPSFIERHGGSEAVRTIAAAEEKEITLYKKYKNFVSYGMYVAKRLPE